MENPIEPLESPVLMVATIAYQILANGELRKLTRPESEFCYAKGWSEPDQAYVGNWLEGFGFFDVHFPKASTRPATEAEIARVGAGELRIVGYEGTFTKRELFPDGNQGKETDE